jgi:hypothetical protein
LCADWGEERGFDLHNATEKEVEDRVRELTLMGEKMVRARLPFLTFALRRRLLSPRGAPFTAAATKASGREEWRSST